MDTDLIAEKILKTFATIAVVGASDSSSKPAHYVPQHMQQLGWRIVPINPLSPTVLGESAYRALVDVPGRVGLVNVFRSSREAPDIARQAVSAGARALWLQLGIESVEAASIARDAGLLYVENRCIMVEQRRLGVSAPTGCRDRD